MSYRSREKMRRRAAEAAAMTPGQVTTSTGVKAQVLVEWLNAKTKTICETVADDYNDIIARAEVGLAVANYVIMIHAVHGAFGDLKTINKRMQGLAKATSDAVAHVTKVGVEEAMEEAKQWGFDMGSVTFEGIDTAGAKLTPQLIDKYVNMIMLATTETGETPN